MNLNHVRGARGGEARAAARRQIEAAAQVSQLKAAVIRALVRLRFATSTLLRIVSILDATPTPKSAEDAVRRVRLLLGSDSGAHNELINALSHPGWSKDAIVAVAIEVADAALMTTDPRAEEALCALRALLHGLCR